MIVKITGNFYTPLVDSNIKFYREGVPTSFGIYDFLEVEGKYFLYVKIPEEKLAGNYSIVLENVEYYVGSQTSQENVEKQFRVLPGVAQFSIEPGILNYTQDQSIVVQNLIANNLKIYSGYKEIKEEIVNVFFNSTNSSVENSTNFISDFWEIFKNEEEIKENVTLAIQEEPENLDYTEVLPGEKKEIELKIKNKLGFQKVWLNSGEENYYVYVWVQELIEGEEKIEENETKKANVTIIIQENETKKEPIIDTEKDLDLKTCEEQGYEICNRTSVCSGKTQNGLDGVCCVGDCEVKEPSSAGKFIGWLMIIALLAFILWFIRDKMVKKKKTPINLMKEAKKSEEEFDVRNTRKKRK